MSGRQSKIEMYMNLINSVGGLSPEELRSIFTEICIYPETPHIYTGDTMEPEEGCQCKLCREMRDQTYEGYEVLAGIFMKAVQQAAVGKGKERHASDKPFEEQQIIKIPLSLGDTHGVSLAFQAIKKTTESFRLKPRAAIEECLGVIVYTAARIYLLEQQTFQEIDEELTPELKPDFEPGSIIKTPSVHIKNHKMIVFCSKGHRMDFETEGLRHCYDQVQSDSRYIVYKVSCSDCRWRGKVVKNRAEGAVGVTTISG